MPNSIFTGLLPPSTASIAATVGIANTSVLSNGSSAYTVVSSNFDNYATNGITLNGGGDIKIDGISLRDFMKAVTTKLSLLVPNPKLEKEWDDLRRIGDEYRVLEQECLNRAKVWDILKTE